MTKSSSGNFAILMIYMVSLSTDIRKLLIILSSQENRFVSFERCHYFMTIPPENGYHRLKEMKEEYRELTSTTKEGEYKSIKPIYERADWPRSGKIDFIDFSVRYRPDLPPVLHHITFSLASGQKLGILGRTGAGKSTLVSSLFRYFADFDGQLLYDGVSIADLDIQQLRAAITVIPQDPVLFAGSLRRNLDPGLTRDPADVETVLREVGLWDRLAAMGGTDFTVEAGGANFSQGEKQLVCFGRALLERNPLVLMDEATASIDSQTEETMQRLVQERFAESTVLMIAHRLHTLLICDQILVLDGGRVLEFGGLAELRERPGSVLRELLKSADLLKEFI